MFYSKVLIIAPPELAPAPAPLGAPVTTTHHVISYTYPSTLLRAGDSLYRLITATYSTGEFYEYAYDTVSNCLSLTTHQGVVNYQYDAANRMEMAGDVSVGWDDNGNMTSFGSRTYTYDHANRLTQVVSGTLTTGFTYRCNCLSSRGLSSGRRASQQAGGNDRTQSLFLRGLV